MLAGMTKPWWCALGLDPDVVDDFLAACADLRDLAVDAWDAWRQPSWMHSEWRLDGSQTAPTRRAIPARVTRKAPADEKKLPFIAVLDELHRLLDDDRSRVTKRKAVELDLSHGAGGHSSAALNALALSAQRLLAHGCITAREAIDGLATLTPPRPPFSSARPEILTKIAMAIDFFQKTHGRLPARVRVGQAEWHELKWGTLTVLGVPVAVDPRLDLGTLIADAD